MMFAQEGAGREIMPTMRIDRSSNKSVTNFRKKAINSLPVLVCQRGFLGYGDTDKKIRATQEDHPGQDGRRKDGSLSTCVYLRRRPARSYRKTTFSAGEQSLSQG